ncbi:MAG TPA: FIST N-terminal domain-containing protein [Thermoguttaceae bacterium]|nr:FIST N-terminal domain-containing protein [Thermoguttaceae bacterium]
MVHRRTLPHLKWTLGLLFMVAGIIVSAQTAFADDDTWSTAPSKADAPIVFETALAVDETGEPGEAGKAVATALKQAMGNTPPKVVIVSECFEDGEYKKEMLEGIYSVLPKQIVVGASSYGAFTQQGCDDFDTVSLLGIGGDGISVAASLVTEMGVSKLLLEEDEATIVKRLHVAGAKVAGKLRKTPEDRLMILIADAHSPKNQFLVEGAQAAIGKKFPITGGSANKNAGQTFVYYGGQMHHDSAVALMLSGDFQVALAGRQAKEQDAVISTAKSGAAEAAANLKAKPLALLAYDCGGRRSKLTNLADEVNAIRQVVGNDLPLFGAYCAGEIGPLDVSETSPDVLSGGGGWHVMFTLIGK